MKCFYYRARSFLSGSFTALAMTLQAWKYKHFFNYFSCAILLKAEIHDMHLSWFKSHVYWYLITLTIDMSATPHMPHGQKSVKLTPCGHIVLCSILTVHRDGRKGEQDVDQAAERVHSGCWTLTRWLLREKWAPGESGFSLGAKRGPCCSWSQDKKFNARFGS